MGIGEVPAEFWWGNVGERDHLEDVGIEGRIILKWIFKKRDEETRIEFIWFRIGTGGGGL